jgi:hypothetical protein
MTYTVRTQTIYTFDNYDEAREYQRATPDSYLSSPRFMVYEVIVDTTPKPQSDETPERQYDATTNDNRCTLSHSRIAYNALNAAEEGV